MSQIEQLEQQLKELSEKIEALKNPELEVGDWVVTRNEIYPIVKITSIKNNKKHSVGFSKSHENHTDDWLMRRTIKRRATPSEIETALRKEAERRGYKEGVLVRSALSEEKVHLGGEIGYVFNRDGTGDDLALGGCCIYSSGKWAEIIKNEKFFAWDVEYNDDDVVFAPDCEAYTFTKESLRTIISGLEHLNGAYSVQRILDELKKLDLCTDH